MDEQLQRAKRFGERFGGKGDVRTPGQSGNIHR